VYSGNWVGSAHDGPVMLRAAFTGSIRSIPRGCVMPEVPDDVMHSLVAAIESTNAKLDEVLSELQRLNREITDMRVDLVDL
jgi:hypothetical protein